MGGHGASGFEGVVIADLNHFVVHAGVQNGRDKTGANALNRVRAFRAARQHRRGLRLDGDNLHPRFFGFQHFAHAGDGAASAHARDKNIHLAIGVGPDFFGGGGAVNGRVGRVFKLLRNQIARVGFGQCLGLGDGAAHALGARRQDQLGAVGAQQLATLAAHGFRHHDGAAVAARGAHHGQTNAGVTRGRLQNNGVRANLAGGFSGIKHGHGDAIFDAVAGVEELQFGHHSGLGTSGEAIQANQRGIANQRGNVLGDVHGGYS